jgi:Domain of unknown function (DUF4234)
MSHRIEIGSIPVSVKVRRPWAVGLLSIVTLGIYSAVWYYKVNREMRDYGSVGGDHDLAESNPVASVLAVTIGSVVVIPALVSLVRTVGRVQRVERMATEESRSGAGPIALLVGCEVISLATAVHGVPGSLSLLGLAAFAIAIALVQARLNVTWQQDGAVVDMRAADLGPSELPAA